MMPGTNTTMKNKELNNTLTIGQFILVTQSKSEKRSTNKSKEQANRKVESFDQQSFFIHICQFRVKTASIKYGDIHTTSIAALNAIEWVWSNIRLMTAIEVSKQNFLLKKNCSRSHASPRRIVPLTGRLNDSQKSGDPDFDYPAAYPKAITQSTRANKYNVTAGPQVTNLRLFLTLGISN
jgi:hypothetical protein